MELCNTERAEVLCQALPYIQAYADKIVVVKYGGNAMLNEELKHNVMGDIVLLSLVGVRVVLVHGGGPEISVTLERMGKENRFVDGLRVTDQETMDVVQMVLAGRVNKGLVSILTSNNCKAMGLSGMDGGMIRARKMCEELGFVGEITSVDPKPILDVLEMGYTPVISSLAIGEDGKTYNINADTAAAHIAGVLGAECLVAMTDIEGVMHDRNDPQSLIPFIGVDEAPALIAKGAVSGGMIPKIECCIDAVRLGVKKAFIIDGRIPHAILIEILTDEGIGTMFA